MPNKMTVREAIGMSVGFGTAAFAFETPPTFDSIEDERDYRNQELALALRLFGKLGFGEAVAGRIAVRGPQNPQRFWANPFGVSLRKIKASDLIRVDHDGNIFDSNRPVNRAALNKAALCLDCEVHKARPGALAGAHAHSLRGKALSNLHRLLDHSPRTPASSTTTAASTTTAVVWSPTARRAWIGKAPLHVDDPRRSTGPARLMDARLGRDRPRQPAIAAGR